ncbi:MAG: hypothetical protein WAV86_11500, partial [Lutibacter sp.]
MILSIILINEFFSSEPSLSNIFSNFICLFFVVYFFKLKPTYFSKQNVYTSGISPTNNHIYENT